MVEYSANVDRQCLGLLMVIFAVNYTTYTLPINLECELCVIGL